MSARRTLIIIVALAVGVVAAIVTVLYVHSAQNRANNNAALVPVYKVSRDIPKSTSGDAVIGGGSIQRSSIPRQFYPSTAVTNLNEIKGKVSAAELVPGQILVNNQFISPTVANTTFSGTELTSGEVAITIELSQTASVAGLIAPGDLVDLMEIFQPTDKTGAPIQPVKDNQYAHFFYQNVKVIAIGTTAAPTPGSSAAATPSGGSSGLFTFAVPADAAERIVLAAAQGTVVAALVPPNNQPVAIPAVQGNAIDTANVTNAKPPALTPYGQ